MEIKNIVQQLESSKVFIDWQDKNKDYYLVHVFFMEGKAPQVGYYSSDTDRIITFDIEDSIVINPTSEVFKDKKKIEHLKLEDIEIDKDRALDEFEKLKKEKYAHEILDKNMILVQTITGKAVYNITNFTKAFKTLNIKINAEDGSILSDSCDSLIGF